MITEIQHIDHPLETVVDVKIIDVQHLKDGIKNLKGMDKPEFCSKYFLSIYPILNIETSGDTDDEELYLNHIRVQHYITSLIMYLIKEHDMYELLLCSEKQQLEMAERKRLTGYAFEVWNPKN